MSNRGSVLLEILVLGFLLTLGATTLLAAALGGVRTVQQAGQLTSGTALAQEILEERRLMPYDQLVPGTEELCPPDCPPGFARLQVAVDTPAYLPVGVKRVQVSLFRSEGAEDPAVQVVSYVRQP